MKRLIYQVYVGKPSKLYDFCTYSVAEYAERIGAEYIQQRQPILRIKPDIFVTNRSKESYEKHGGFLPIFEKENAFSYLKQYDQVAIIDADVWIRPNASNIFNKVTEEYDFGGVVEREMPITPKYANKIANYSRMQYGMLQDIDWQWNQYGAEFFNMGIMVLNKSIDKYINGTPEEFIRRPEFKRFVDGLGPWKWSTDQTLLNYWVKKTNMNCKHLSYHFNGLYSAIPDQRIKESNFVHFFLKDLLPERGENVEELMRYVR